MDARTKRLLIVVTYGIILFVLLMNLCTVFSFIKSVLTLLIPVFAGLVIAFVLNVPVGGFEKITRGLCKRCKIAPKDKMVDSISLTLTLISVTLAGYLVYTMIVPELLNSVKSIGILIKDKWPEWMALLDGYGINTESVSEWMNNTGFAKLLEIATGTAGSLIDSIANVSASVFSVALTGLFAVVISIYILIDKRNLYTQGKKILYANVKEERADKVCHIASVFQKVYAKFLSGQCIEAVILGFLVFVAFTIAKLPYASLIAVLAMVFAFIPYIGAYVVCILAAIFTFIASPSQVVLCVVLYLVVQFIETQFIYPRVVGSSVGLSPLWTLIAAIIGGELFGLVGIIFFIPLVAAVNELLKENTDNKLEQKDIL